MARPCLRCQAPSSRGRQNGTAAVDPPCTCRFINGTTRHRGSFSSALPLGSLRGAWFYVARTRRSQRADSGSFVQIQRQSPCQYVNYCLRSFPCLCANSLAVRLFARASSSLCRTSYRLSHYCSIVCEPFRVLSQNPSPSASPLTPRRCSNRIFSPLRQDHCQTEDTSRSRVKWSAHLAGNVVPPPSGGPTKLPAAILRGAPFGYSSPTRNRGQPS